MASSTLHSANTMNLGPRSLTRAYDNDHVELARHWASNIPATSLNSSNKTWTSSQLLRFAFSLSSTLNSNPENYPRVLGSSLASHGLNPKALPSKTFFSHCFRFFHLVEGTIKSWVVFLAK